MPSRCPPRPVHLPALWPSLLAPALLPDPRGPLGVLAHRADISPPRGLLGLSWFARWKTFLSHPVLTPGQELLRLSPDPGGPGALGSGGAPCGPLCRLYHVLSEAGNGVCGSSRLLSSSHEGRTLRSGPRPGLCLRSFPGPQGLAGRSRRPHAQNPGWLGTWEGLGPPQRAPPSPGPHGARGPRVSGKPGLPAPVLLARLGRNRPPTDSRVNLSLQPHAGTWLLPTQSRQTQEQSHSLLSTYDSFLEFSGGSVG